ncbi:LOW QUALITY PROTEIN: hypothetical protein ACG7TL_001843 [Trametes sanguinea]
MHELDPPFLFELIQDENGAIILGPNGEWEHTNTDRAKKAQAEKLEKLYAKWPPVEKLNPSFIASEHYPHPIRRFYGWPYPLRFIKAFAKQYDCRSSRLPPKAQKKESVIFGKLTEAYEAADVDLTKYVNHLVHHAVEIRLIKAGGVHLQHGTPFCRGAFGIFVLWDNYNMYDRLEYMEPLGLSPDEVIDNVHKTISDCDPGIKLAWYYDVYSLKVNLTTPV